MSKNIVILSGSPRKGGTTDKLVSAFMEGAEPASKTVALFRVADLKIGGCLGCNHCFKETGVCVQKDDMLPIFDALRKADAVVFASPIYFFAVTAQLKLAIDRIYALLKEGTPAKRAALLLTCDAETNDVTASAVTMFHMISNYQKWDEAGIVTASGLHNTSDIDGRKELEEARQLGKEI
ncbi:MAG: flavodoxin family protein [Clostridiales bacterium]|jgi:multimeric flavodoxin WrbA|nr:flavodoxin family protein [Clostridiales bacterium]